MNKTNQVIAIFLTLLLLSNCSSFVEGLGGTKKKGSDEFLVEKKAPLVLPPSFEKLPEPKKITDQNAASIERDISSIKKIINKKSSIDTNKEDSELNSSIEKSIIDKINKTKIREENLDEVMEEEMEIPKKKNFFKRLREKFN
tara:strand:+ start:1069 stop:1497 length:429 start_codon:yes stop_codon:yes gene_type:complete